MKTQLLLILSGMLLVVLFSDGTWENANMMTYIGLMLSSIAILLSPIKWLIDKWKR